MYSLLLLKDHYPNEYDEQIVRLMEFHYSCLLEFDYDLRQRRKFEVKRTETTNVFVERLLLPSFSDDNHRIIVASFVFYE